VGCVDAHSTPFVVLVAAGRAEQQQQAEQASHGERKTKEQEQKQVIGKHCLFL